MCFLQPTFMLTTVSLIHAGSSREMNKVNVGSAGRWSIAFAPASVTRLRLTLG